jgi:hypothetical protein
MNKKFVIICSSITAFLLLLIFIVVGSTKKGHNIENETQITEGASQEGEVTLKSQEGNYSVKITAVFEAEPNSDDENAPEAERVAVVVYEYKNADITDGLSIGNTHFKAYDKRGKELKQYPQNGMFEPSEIGESGVFTASVAFALNNDNNYLKIEYYNDTASKKPDATFEQTW